MSEEDCQKVENKVDEIVQWIDNNADATIEDYERMRKELDAVCKPVLEKFKQAKVNRNKAGGSGGAGPKAGPSGATGGPNKGNPKTGNPNNKSKSRTGPIIEELD